MRGRKAMLSESPHPTPLPPERELAPRRQPSLGPRPARPSLAGRSPNFLCPPDKGFRLTHTQRAEAPSLKRGRRKGAQEPA